MMRLLIITVAGKATRFQTNVQESIIKCLYTEGDKEKSLLLRLLENFSDIDKYIIVGGYEFETLKKALEVDSCFNTFRDRMVLVRNEKYEEYGSGYSLYRGLEEAIKYRFDEIIFAEGDLFVDQLSCKKILESKKSILTINHEPILADKAVALYLDKDGKVHYIYDTQHGILEVGEPFTAILNSGQIWKFSDVNVTRKVFDKLTDLNWQGTNLVYVEEYFKHIKTEDIEIISFKDWINCNTIEDYRKIKDIGELEE